MHNGSDIEGHGVKCAPHAAELNQHALTENGILQVGDLERCDSRMQGHIGRREPCRMQPHQISCRFIDCGCTRTGWDVVLRADVLLQRLKVENMVGHKFDSDLLNFRIG